MNFSASQITSPWNPIQPFGCDSTAMPDRIMGLGSDDQGIYDVPSPSQNVVDIQEYPVTDPAGGYLSVPSVKPQLTGISIVAQSRYNQMLSDYLHAGINGQYGLAVEKQLSILIGQAHNILNQSPSTDSTYLTSAYKNVERQAIALIASIPGVNQNMDAAYARAFHEWRQGHYPYTNPPQYWAAALHSPPYVP